MNTSVDMNVIKRDGSSEPVSFDKVLARIRKAATGLSVNFTRLAQLTLAEIHDGVRTSELDELAARIAVSYTTDHPDWGLLAAQIILSNCQKNAPARFSDAIIILSGLKDVAGAPAPAVHPDVTAFVVSHKDTLDALVKSENDFLLDYFGFKTLERAYLMRDRSGRVIETPQFMWLRVAVGLWFPNIEKIRETYELMSAKAFTHATPTLFNSGSPRPQLSSCFLIAMKDDSVDGIFDTLKECAQISKYAGGIGLHVHNVRAQGTLIAGTGGTSNGLLPMLRVFNNTARYIDQCFLPGTLVYTDAGPKAIETIGITDKVLTSSGCFEQINKPLRHDYSGPIRNIRIKHSLEPIQVTPEHNVMVLTGIKTMTNYSLITNRLNKGLCTIEWVDVKDLQVDDYMVFQIPTYEKDIESISEDDCRFYGIMLGDGTISASLSGVTMNTITKKSAIDFVTEYMTRRGVKLYGGEEPNVTNIRWSTMSPGFKLTVTDLYNYTKDKCISHHFLHLPKPKILQLLRGLIETDGCVGTKEIALEMTSKILLEQIRYLILRLGGLTSGYGRNRIGNVSPYRNITTRKLSWCIRIPRLPEIMVLFPAAPPSEYFSFFRHGNLLMSRIESIEEDTYTGVVHDFEVNNTHDYTVSHLGVVHNGGGRRNGSFAVYLEPWHADTPAFLKMKSNTGSEEERARDLFYALWIPDLFMRRVEAAGSWSLFCPHEAPGLADVTGAEFDALYERYEREGRAKKVVEAQKIWSDILVSQIETGTPYLLYKDAANAKSNQKNLGVIKSSNLCVAPHTRLSILTDTGDQASVPIVNLAGKEITVWNGTRYTRVRPVKTGGNEQLIRVTVAQTPGNRVSLECTYEHKFIMESDESLATAPRMAARDLVVGDRLCSWRDFNGRLIHQTVVAIEEVPELSDTYCFTEDENHVGIFNGILTGQCTEIIEYSSPEETAVCNLASLALPYFVTKDRRFDFDRLRSVVATVTENLNRVIDINYYPTESTKRSNMRHRPIGLGVQGLADVFALLGLPWESEGASLLNRQIFEHIYYAALDTSTRLSEESGPYETFAGSPMSKGLLQPDLWNLDPASYATATTLDWITLRAKASKGVRNSLLVAPMPTASTSQILGYTECIEPTTTNIYARRTLAGEFTVINKYLVTDLLAQGLWNKALKDRIIGANGSIQAIEEIPAATKALYKTVWEIKQKTLIDMAADRGAFICQSQSLNLFVPDPTIAKLSSMHFYGWKKGLKTGIYYLRTKSAVQAIKFTVDATTRAPEATKTPEECLLCSS